MQTQTLRTKRDQLHKEIEDLHQQARLLVEKHIDPKTNPLYVYYETHIMNIVDKLAELGYSRAAEQLIAIQNKITGLFEQVFKINDQIAPEDMPDTHSEEFDNFIKNLLTKTS